MSDQTARLLIELEEIFGGVASKHGGQRFRDGNLVIAWRGGDILYWNNCVCDGEAVTDLQAEARRAAAFMRRQADAGSFVLLTDTSKQYAPDLQPTLNAMRTATIMSGDALKVSTLPSKPGAIIRRATTEEDYRIIAEINGQSTDRTAQSWLEELHMDIEHQDGIYAVYLEVDSKPVSAAVGIAASVPHLLALGLVATVPAARGKGYGEMCCREALARIAKETGRSRTSLSARPAAQGIYRRMGFEAEGMMHIYTLPSNV